MQSRWVIDPKDGKRHIEKTWAVEGPDPASPWQPTISPSGEDIQVTVVGTGPRPSRFARFWASRPCRFVVFLALIGGFTALLTLSSQALFNVILALGVAGVVSASWKFSA
jgi:hypothetical protein